MIGRQSENNAPVWRKLLGLAGLRVIAMALVFLQALVLARVFGAETFAYFSFAVSVVSVVVLVVGLGLDQLLMRELGKLGLVQAARSARFRALARFVLWAQVSAAVLVAALVGILVTFTPVAGGYWIGLLGVFAILPVLIMRKLLEAIAQGAHHPQILVLGAQIGFPLCLILCALTAAYVVNWQNVAGLTAAYVVAVSGSLALTFWMARGIVQQLMAEPLFDRGAIERRKTITAGMSFAFVSAGFVLSQHIDVLMLGVLATPLDVALVRVGSRLAEAAALLRAMALLQYKPLMAEAAQHAGKTMLQQRVRELAGIFAVTGLPAGLVLWVFAGDLLALFGAEFRDAVWIMRLYLLGVLFLMMCGPCSSALAMAGQERIAARLVWVALGVGGVLNLLLIPVWGGLGCALSNLCAMGVLGLSSCWQCSRRLGVQTSVLQFLKPINQERSVDVA